MGSPSLPRKQKDHGHSPWDKHSVSVSKLELTKGNNLYFLLAGTEFHVCSVSIILSYLKCSNCD